MGISKEAFEKIGGFPVTSMHPGEDMAFSIEILRQGFRTKLIKEAHVYHKRRNTLKSFFVQVHRFGKTRVVISKIYPQTFKIFFFAPTFFIFFTLLMLIFSIFNILFILPILIYISAVFAESVLKNKNISVAVLSIVTSFIQLFGYGTGFFISFLRTHILGKDEYNVLKTGFYK